MNKYQKKLNKELHQYINFRKAVGSPILNLNYRHFRRYVKAKVKFLETPCENCDNPRCKLYPKAWICALQR